MKNPTERKQWVMEAAFKSFALFGYKATTMEQVAKIANVGKGTIYTFFATKEELFQSIIEQLIIEMKVVAEDLIDRKLSFFDNLHRVLYGMLQFRDKHELTIRLSHEVQEMGTPMAKEGLQQVEQAIRKFIEREIERAIAQREIKTCDPKITAYVMFKLYIAFISDWSKKHEALSKEEIARLFQLYLGEGLRLDSAR
ncbi:TetR/AcrR family transcriptional regulator [Marinicrinis sediminis]|uniref:TetR/AcrR family transcriptional regulator n=1 Tax=Marinicrinis sediminis TaxID=1652465 RepID=A0ABW5R7Z1_9BACL